MTQTGIITKAVAGFYYVEACGQIYECRARGIFRKNKRMPLVGDNVIISIPENGMAMVDEIQERKNELIRPPLANLDKLFIVVSSCEPTPNKLVIDRLIAHAEYKDIEPILVFTKNDLENNLEIEEIYRTAGFKTFIIDYSKKESVDEIKKMMNGNISAFAGNSGVGKSTLINAIMPYLNLETAQISEKLGRGRHTTRQVELFHLENGGLIADTPGFSSLDIENGEKIYKEDLADCFRDFNDYKTDCKFRGCSHTVEKGCAVLEALKDGLINSSRHESYCALYDEVKEIREWQYK